MKRKQTKKDGEAECGRKEGGIGEAKVAIVGKKDTKGRRDRGGERKTKWGKVKDEVMKLPKIYKSLE